MRSWTTPFYVTGGTLRPDAPSYIERQADRDLFEGLLNGEFCYVLTARQMGKSSLMVRTANKLREQAIHVIALDLSAIGQNLTPEQWYNGLLTSMGDQLGMEDELEQFWVDNPRLSPVQRWFTAIRKGVLAWREGPVVIFLDEIDTVRSLPFSTDEFFAAIRESFNRRSEDSEFNRLTFCLLGVATPSDLIRDTRITPFNIGRRIELNDFTPEEAAPLARGLLADATLVPAMLRRVLSWTSGHPYLTQRLCQALAQDLHTGRRADVDRLCEELFLSNRARERDDNLIFVRERLLRSEADVTSLLELYLNVRSEKRVTDDESNPLVSILRLSGIVRSLGGCLVERNRIYYRVFDRNWVKSNLPDADLIRQRQAYRRGLVRATALASVVIAALVLLSLVAVNKTSEAHLAEAKAWRSSGRMGQRTEALRAIERARRWGIFSRNVAELRNEAIAALNLVDLKDDPVNYPSIESSGANPTGPELNADFSRYAVGEQDGRVVIFNAATRDVQLFLPGFGQPVRWLRFSFSDEYLGVGYGNEGRGEQRFVLWRLADKSAIRELAEDIARDGWDISPNGSRLAVGLNQQDIRIYSLPGGELLPETRPAVSQTAARRISWLRFDPSIPSGTRLAECSPSSLNLYVWDIAQQTIETYPHTERLVDVEWHPKGHQLVTACENGDIYLLDPRTKVKDRLYNTSVNLVPPDVCFNRVGTVLATVCSDFSLRLWRPENRRQILSSFDLDERASLRFSADDRWLSLTTGSRGVRLLKVEGGRELVTFHGEPNTSDAFESIGFDTQGRVLIAAGPRGGIWLWNTRDLRSATRLDLAGLISTVGFDRQGAALLASTTGGFFQLPVRSVRRSGEEELYIERAQCLAFRLGLGRFALTTNGTAAVVHTGQAEDHIHVFALRDPNHSSRWDADRKLDAITIAPDGRWLFAGARAERVILVWDLSGKKGQKPFQRFLESRYPSLSPSGRWLVTASEAEFRFHNVGSWSVAQLSIPHSLRFQRLAPVAFAPLPVRGECLLAAATSPTTIEVFRFQDQDSPKVKKLAELESPDGLPVVNLAFDPTGGQLAAGSASQIVHVWDLASIREELHKRGLASDFPKFRPLSSDKLGLVVEASRESEDHTLRRLEEEWLTELDQLTEQIEAAAANGGQGLFSDLVRRGRLYRDLRRFEMARRDLNKALELRPDDESVRRMIDAVERERELNRQAPDAAGAPASVEGP